MILHANYAAQLDRRLSQSPDTDVLDLSISHFRSLDCPKLWFRTCVKDRHRLIQVHDLVHVLGVKMCIPLLGFHAITGCDSSSSLAGIGKKKVWDGFCRSIDHQDSLSCLREEQELSLTTADKCKAYVWSLHTASKKTSIADELRYLMFCQRKQKNEMLPPTSDSFLQQSNYQAFVWRHAFEAMQDLEPPECRGWGRNEELFVSLLVTKALAPESLFELTTCKCKTSACLRNCSCTNRGLVCTERCYCVADDEASKNPNVLTFISDSEEE